LRDAFPAYRKKLPTRKMPSFLVRFLAMVNPPLKQILPELDKQRLVSNEKAQRVLGVTFRPARESILDGAQTLIDHKVV
jgi:dihydroflavonol-4-reductase